MRTRLIQMAFLNAFMAGIDLPGPRPWLSSCLSPRSCRSSSRFPVPVRSLIALYVQEELIR
jgi:hypothetical protein